jgi:nitrous oxidase accessory protein NosD
MLRSYLTMRCLILAALLIAFTRASALPEAEGNTLCADLNAYFKLTFSITAHGGNGKTIRVRPNQSIQRAIASAPRGSRIIVERGEYKEQLTIKTNDLTLIGERGATLLPPPVPVTNECTNFAGPNDDQTPTQAGICIIGAGLALDGFVSEHVRVKAVQRPVRGVKVTGFTVKEFSGFNILVVGAQDTEICDNKLLDSPKYGFLTAGSVNTKVSGNEIGSTRPENRFIGLCMDNFSRVKVTGNKISNYFIGLCIQTDGAEVEDNRVSNACFGAFLDPGVRDVRLRGNRFTDAFPNGCAGFGAAAISVDGAVGARVENNFIKGWKTEDAQNLTAGIAVVDDPCLFPSLSCEGVGIPAVARDNVVKGNVLRDNNFDIFVNTTGSGNEFKRNRCDTSNKAGVCRSG